MRMQQLETRKLTFKQRKWLDKYYETGNATEAARYAYNCNDNSARNIGYENVAKLDFQRLLDGVGLTDYRLSKKISDKLDAKRPVNLHFDNNTKKTQMVTVEDHVTQLKATEIALKLKNRLTDRVDVSGEVNAKITVEVNTNQGYLARLVEAEVTPSTGYAGEPAKIQGTGVASKSEENIDSDPRTS